MAAGRLSNTSRDALIRSILNHRFDGDRKKLEKLHEETDQAIIKHMVKDLTKQEQKDYSHYVEKNWFDKSKSAKLQFRPGSFVEHQFKLYRQLPKPLNRVHIVEEGDPLFSLYPIYADQKDALEAEEKEAKTATKQVVYSCSSVKRLIEVWPEAERFVIGLGLHKKQAALPAVQIDKVNSLLKLP